MIAPRLPFDRVLYVARIGAEVTKIGSADPRRVATRIRTLSSEHRAHITVVALAPSTFQHETEAVRRFAALAVAGRREYFRDDGSIAAWVASLPAEHRCHIEHAYLGPKGKGPTARRHVPTITDAACTFAHPVSPSHNARHSLNTAPARSTAPRGCGALPHRDTEVCA